MKFKFLLILLGLFFNSTIQGIEKCYNKEVIENLINSSIKFYQKNKDYSLITFSIEQVPVDIYIPELSEKCCYKILLVLPGWNFSRKRWFSETDLLNYIKTYYYIAIAPETKTTIYESNYYPETKIKWHTKPGMEYFVNDFFPFFEKYKIFINSKYNFSLGLSTGGRGTVMIASKLPNKFFAIATLSGDFDQTITPEDNLMKLVYGPYSKFSERWKEDNPLYLIKKNGWNSHIYIGHGKEDNIVPSLHSKHFYEFLSKEKFPIKIHYSIKEKYKHDFYYWNSELKNIFDFFESLINL